MAKRGLINGIDSYKHSRIHILLKRKYGPAVKCDNKECSGKGIRRFEWALIKGRTYSLDKNDYMQLCVSCHRKYDDSPERRRKISEDHKGKIYHNRSRIIGKFDSNWNLLKIYESSNDAERRTGVTHANIYNSIKKKCKAGGFYWMHLDGK